MKLHIFSDLHFDHTPGWLPQLASGADAVLCAGDVCEGLPEAFAYLRRHIPAPTPIITVAGNHSFYHRVMPEEMARGCSAAREHGITFLEDEAAIIGGVRFVGATLWTDYALYGADDRSSAMAVATRVMNDHRMIWATRSPPTRFEPQHAEALHFASVKALDHLLSAPFDGPTVVLTHHAPHIYSIAPKYAGSDINSAFASDLTSLIYQCRPFAWVHGHTHSSADYRVGGALILNNPHGYGSENPGFDPALILDTEAQA